MIANRLVKRHRSAQSGGDTAARAAAIAGDNLYRELSRWLGSDGCHALFTRALADARKDYPALAEIQLHARTEPYIGGVPNTIAAHGDPAVAEAIESTLGHIAELLERLIGTDMATTLIKRSWGARDNADTTSYARREEA